MLESVELLLENIDAERAIITADHGNAFGEWGYYRHPEGCPIPAVRNVPWIVTSARDQKTHEPEEYDTDEVVLDVKEHLEALGYV